jgi:hypothetical protein
VLRWIASRPPAEQPLHALGLALQEDLAWIESPAAGEPAHASMLHVCWPSGWDPAVKIGRDFATIHAPVADGDALRAAALPLSRALTTQGPFVRFVWTIAPDGAWSRHPGDLGVSVATTAASDATLTTTLTATAGAAPDAAVGAAVGAAVDAGAAAAAPWFRCERQVSVPLRAPGLAAGGAALFLIRLHVAPLAEVATDRGRLAVVRDALASMSAATLEYKGLASRRDALLAWLDARLGEGTSG